MIIYHLLAGVSELADEADSKSVDGNIVRVQVPPPAGTLTIGKSFFFAIENHTTKYCLQNNK